MGESQMRVDAELDEVIQALADARQVADAVAVAVLERARIDLVDYAALPPGEFLHPTNVLRSEMGER